MDEKVKKDRISMTIEITLERRHKLKMFSSKNGITIKELIAIFIDKLDDQ